MIMGLDVQGRGRWLSQGAPRQDKAGLSQKKKNKEGKGEEGEEGEEGPEEGEGEKKKRKKGHIKEMKFLRGYR